MRNDAFQINLETILFHGFSITHFRFESLLCGFHLGDPNVLLYESPKFFFDFRFWHLAVCVWNQLLFQQWCLFDRLNLKSKNTMLQSYVKR